MTRFSLPIAVFLSLISLAVVAEASDFIGPDLLIPIAGRTDGAHGSRWQTDILITNTSRSWASEPVLIVFRRDGTPDLELSSTIEPRATLILRDAIRTTFGREDGVGTIRVIAASDRAMLSARARIYNTASEPGEFGQIVQGVVVSNLPREACLPGLSGLPPNRTNVGIANATAEHAHAVLTLWDRNGEMRRGILVEIPAGGFLVLNDVFAHLGTGPLDGATIHVVASHPFYAWASIVRSDSGDSDFVAASGIER
jgi:hypothetical protein